MTETFREMFFWPGAVLFLWAAATTVFGLVRWSKGGLKDVYTGLVFVVGLGFLLLDGVVSNNTRIVLMAPALALLFVWRFRQKRGRRNQAQPSQVGR